MKKYLYYSCLALTSIPAFIYSLALIGHVHLTPYLPPAMMPLLYFGTPYGGRYPGFHLVNLIGTTLFLILAVRRIFYAIGSRSLTYPQLFDNVPHKAAWLGVLFGLTGLALYVTALKTGYISLTLGVYPFIISGSLLYWSILIPELAVILKFSSDSKPMMS